MATLEPGNMGDPPPPGAPGLPRPGTEPGGPFSVQRIPVAQPISGPLVAGTTPGDSVLAQLIIEAQDGLGQAPEANSSARLQQGGGTYPS